MFLRRSFDTLNIHTLSRSWTLSIHLHHLIQIRLASSTSNQTLFPYPKHARPTPHQIFHLPPNASQQEIKARYYDLVRAHHPDSPLCRDVSHEDRQARFQAITAAYDLLRGVRPRGAAGFAEELGKRRRGSRSARHRRQGGSAGGDDYSRAHEYGYATGLGGDDRWKDRVIVFAGIFTLAVGLAPGVFLFPVGINERHRSASANLAEARKEAREDGAARRKEVRRRVVENNRLQRSEERGDKLKKDSQVEDV